MTQLKQQQVSEESEVLEFDGCHAWILRRNGKVAIAIEHTKPEALILLSGLIHILGEPENYSHEEGDDGVIFCFKDKSVENEVTQAWRDIFGKGQVDEHHPT